MKIIFTFLSVAFVLIRFDLSAQTLEVISSGGSYSESSGGSLSSTIGEVMIETQEGSVNHLTQGFQQPNIYVLGIQNFDNSFEINVFPNPTTDFININSTKSTNLKIYDASGKLVLQTILNETDQIQMSQFSDGIYQLVFSDSKGILKTLKVIVQ